jgi:hypothetical protein
MGVRALVKESIDPRKAFMRRAQRRESRKLKSSEYEDVQNSIDLVRKLIKYLRMRYLVHMHANEIAKRLYPDAGC